MKRASLKAYEGGKIDNAITRQKEENVILSRSNASLRRQRNKARYEARRLDAGLLITSFLLLLCFLYAVGSGWSGAGVVGMVMLVPLGFVVFTEYARRGE